MHGTLEELCLFFNLSPKRQSLLEDEIKAMENVSHTKLVNLCKTRWVARIDAYEAFAELMTALVTTLQTISSSPGWNTESSRKATSLIAAVTNFTFIHAFVVTRHCLAYIKGLTKSLQSKTQDVVKAYKEVNSIIATLEDTRNSIDAKHVVWFQEAEQLGASISAPAAALPRVCGRQRHRPNMPAGTPEEYFKRTTAIPFIGEFLGQLKRRFSEAQKKAVEAMAVVPAVLHQGREAESEVSIERMLEAYGADLPCPLVFEEEFAIWKHKWKDVPAKECPADLMASLQHADKMLFPNINCLLRILCTLPVTSCECERSISVLRHLKSYMRANIGEERLTGLALLHTKYTMELNLEEILDIFAGQHPRRMTL